MFLSLLVMCESFCVVSFRRCNVRRYHVACSEPSTAYFGRRLFGGGDVSRAWEEEIESESDDATRDREPVPYP
jgi:hypothetical protein